MEQTCAVTNCDRKISSRGLCSSHRNHISLLVKNGRLSSEEFNLVAPPRVKWSSIEETYLWVQEQLQAKTATKKKGAKRE